jgi:anti-sigma regulatory factor (Ser/Thr protein kinase)
VRQQSAPHGRETRTIDLRLPANQGAPSQARRAVGDLGLPDRLRDDAVLLVSELVTNSLRHSGIAPDDDIEIRLVRGPDRVRVEVSDHAGATSRRPIAGSIKPKPGQSSGWGLFLVDRLAVRWGNAPGHHWFELEIPHHDPT